MSCSLTTVPDVVDWQAVRFSSSDGQAEANCNDFSSSFEHVYVYVFCLSFSIKLPHDGHEDNEDSSR